MRKLFLITMVLLLGSAVCTAQQKYPYQDTANPDPQVVTEIPEDDAPKKYTTGDDEYAGPSKDTAIVNLALRLSTDSVNYIKANRDYAYAKYLDSLLRAVVLKDSLKSKPQPKEQQQQGDKDRKIEFNDSEPYKSTSFDGFFSSPAFRIILIILAVAFLAFVIYKLFLQGRMNKKVKKQPGAPQDESKEDDLMTIPESGIDGMIASAVRNGNYRLATRYWYIKVLHLLNDRGMVKLAQEKTNYQYVNEITNPGYRDDFARLTLNYEYVWYGEFAVDQIIYHKLEGGFSSFAKKI